MGEQAVGVKEAEHHSPEGSALPQILVVDDDGEILALVARFLRAHGFRVHAARNGAEMNEVLRQGAIDLIILDLMLPGRSGLDLCRDLRRTSSLPVIMLTAKGEETDRIVGLEVGADDYLPKPFNPRELLARINAVLRRVRTQATAAHTAGRGFLFAGWRLDTLKRELMNPKGVVVDLSTGEYEFLLAFLEAPQRVLTREFLLDAARNRASDAFDRAIDVQVSRLRRKLDDAGELIKTIRGAGYFFSADVTRV
ncbi:response regulator [Rhizobiales bacterium TNE-4]|nr:response regulator [Rhizobiales bacterium TNE-4]MBV1827541.1 response regulator [Rhizobiales bacterium TNE-4]